MLQAESSILVAKFMIFLKNGSRYKLNHPNQRGSNFTLLDFHEYFGFSGPIKNGANLGPPDLESSQTNTPADTHIVHFS
jgi:hypothetical protein